MLKLTSKNVRAIYEEFQASIYYIHWGIQRNQNAEAGALL